LTGIISATDSFQRKNTTPRSLAAAATLMEKGADQQETIRWLYKTQPLHVLKLWGRAMARLNWDEKSKLAWTGITMEDFVQSRASQKDIPLILEKLQENYGEGRFFMLLYNDTPESSISLLRGASLEPMKKLREFLNGQIKQDVLEIRLSTGDLMEAGELLAKRIKEFGTQI